MSGAPPQEHASMVVVVGYERPFRWEIEVRNCHGTAAGPVSASAQVHAALLGLRRSCDRHLAVLESVMPGAREVPR